MTRFSRGDIILVNFIFSDETGIKHRPALIVSSDSYHRTRNEIIVSAVTSNLERVLVGDHVISKWKDAGLLLPSVATGILRTIKMGMVEKKLGSLDERDLLEIDEKLRLILGLR
jgi:mRNA interferase MazF